MGVRIHNPAPADRPEPLGPFPAPPPKHAHRPGGVECHLVSVTHLPCGRTLLHVVIGGVEQVVWCDKWSWGE